MYLQKVANCTDVRQTGHETRSLTGGKHFCMQATPAHFGQQVAPAACARDRESSLYAALHANNMQLL